MPEDINYNELVSISTEGRQKLSRIKPENIGQAGRISGVSPSDINIIINVSWKIKCSTWNKNYKK